MVPREKLLAVKKEPSKGTLLYITRSSKSSLCSAVRLDLGELWPSFSPCL